MALFTCEECGKPQDSGLPRWWRGERLCTPCYEAREVFERKEGEPEADEPKDPSRPLHTLAIWCPEGKGSTASVCLDGHNLGEIAQKVTLEITRDRARVILDLNGKALRIEAEGLVEALKERAPEPGAEKLALALMEATTWERSARDSRDAAESTVGSLAAQRDRMVAVVEAADAWEVSQTPETREALLRAIRLFQKQDTADQAPPSGASILDSDKPDPED